MGIYKRDKIYHMTYTDKEGKRHRESTECTDRRLAQDVLSKIKTEIFEDKFFDKKKKVKVEFDEFCEKYLEEYSKIDKKTSWKKSDWVQIRALKKYFSGKYLTEITPHVIDRYKGKRSREVAPATVNRGLARLKSIFSKAIIWGDFYGENPVKKIKFLTEPPSRDRFLSKKEIKELIKCSEEDLKPLIIIAINTGIRQSNLLDLKWTDADFKKELLCLEITKNKEKRFVPMNSDVVSALKRVRKQSDSPYIFRKKVIKKDGAIGYRGTVYLRGAFDRAKKKAGIKNYTWHDHRTTCGSWLAMNGVPIKTIGQILGHRSLRMTDKYVYLSEQYQKDAVSLLQGLTGNEMSKKPKKCKG